MVFCPDVQAGIIVGRLDPVDLGDFDEANFSRVLDDDALKPPGSRFFAGARRLSLDAVFTPAVLTSIEPNSLLRALQRQLEARVVERLQQVVERSRGEGAKRVLIVGGDEDDGRGQVAAQQLKHVESVAL